MAQRLHEALSLDRELRGLSAREDVEERATQVHEGLTDTGVRASGVAPPAPFVPIPYPNIGKASDTSQGTTKVEADGQMVMVKGAKYMMSAGDEPGTIGGIISSTFKQECEFLMYSFDVMIEGKNVCRMGDPLWHNKKNICG